MPRCPDAPTSDDRLFCFVYGRGDRKTDQFVPGWPYSFVIEHVLDRFPDRVFAFDEFGPLGIRPTAGSS